MTYGRIDPLIVGKKGRSSLQYVARRSPSSRGRNWSPIDRTCEANFIPRASWLEETRKDFLQENFLFAHGSYFESLSCVFCRINLKKSVLTVKFLPFPIQHNNVATMKLQYCYNVALLHCCCNFCAVGVSFVSIDLWSN